MKLKIVQLHFLMKVLFLPWALLLISTILRSNYDCNRMMSEMEHKHFTAGETQTKHMDTLNCWKINNNMGKKHLPLFAVVIT